MIVSNYLPEKNALKLKIYGAFDISMALEFRKTYLQHSKSNNSASVEHYVIDFTDTSRLDSAAIGGLMLWSDYMKMNNPNAGLYLTNANNDILNVLHMFKIERICNNIKLH